MELHETPYAIIDLWWIMYKVFHSAKLVGVRHRAKYINVPCAFDIEVSSFYDGDEKRACMYIWMLGIGGYCVVGRTWNEFRNVIDYISDYLGLSKDLILVLYVHNLSYEFQFIKDMFEWEKVFAINDRKPNYVLCKQGIEFRCSYQLSGYSLAMVGKNLQRYKVRKLEGDLDYNKIRHCETPLTTEEMAYCVHDVLVVMAYIQECIETEGNITQIPNTKTGYVRRDVKRKCLGAGKKSRKKNWMYRDYIHGLTLESDEYLQLRRAFQGGFTHASVLYSGRTIEDVDSYDFTSSYPTVMLCEKFPMSVGRLVDIHNRDDIDNYCAKYCCLFDVQFLDITPKYLFEDYISISRCRNVKNAVVNNGRVVSADSITTTITEQDYMLIKAMYDWGKMRVANFRIYEKRYLPKEFIDSILTFYEDKTKLKDVKGKEVEYMHAKANLNSLYGMAVTDIIRDEITYDSEWIVEQPNLDDAIEKYNKGLGRFLFYPWGVWVTAYARKNLFTGILECKNDYVYSDTDSLKMLNGDKHREYIEKYNDVITKQLMVAMRYHGIDFERTRPKTIDGIEKPIGVWDYEGHYKKFKTLGAKRYLWLNSKNEMQMTVAGLSKQSGLKYLQFGELSGKSIFDKFNDDMYIPREWTGKNIHTYIDFPTNGTVTDYLGKPYEYSELSSVHMEPTDYSLSIGAEYANFIAQVQEKSD